MKLKKFKNEYRKYVKRMTLEDVEFYKDETQIDGLRKLVTIKVEIGALIEIENLVSNSMYNAGFGDMLNRIMYEDMKEIRKGVQEKTSKLIEKSYENKTKAI